MFTVAGNSLKLRRDRTVQFDRLDMLDRSSALTIAFALGLAVATSGCAHVGLGAEAPDVTPVGVSVQSVGATGVAATVHLSVFNPNAFSVPLRRARFAIDLGGAELSSGDIELPVSIPAKASAPVDASVRVDGFSAAAAAARYAAGERRYRLRGTLFFATRLGDIAVEIEHQGHLGDLLDVATRP